MGFPVSSSDKLYLKNSYITKHPWFIKRRSCSIEVSGHSIHADLVVSPTTVDLVGSPSSVDLVGSLTSVDLVGSPTSLDLVGSPASVCTPR